MPQMTQIALELSWSRSRACWRPAARRRCPPSERSSSWCRSTASGGIISIATRRRNLARLAARGVRSEGLIPQFPSKTFPNHYTIVTGLRLANHGIISNNMRAADIPGDFSLSNRDVLADPRWWGGEPIWNTAEQQGRIAAAMFWPGSETVIGGRQATFWKPFDDDLPHPERVSQVLSWLKLPEGKRPSFLTLYYSEVDNAGHDDGPESEAVNDAVRNVDRSLGELVAGVNTLGLADRVHYIVVSDHGMAALSPDRMIVLDNYIDVAAMDVVDWAPVLGLVAERRQRGKALRRAEGQASAPRRVSEERDPCRVRPRRATRDCRRSSGLPMKGWYITSKREVDRWGQSDRRAARRHARLRRPRAIDARPLRGRRVRGSRAG